jgi:hypothetical protein
VTCKKHRTWRSRRDETGVAGHLVAESWSDFKVKNNVDLDIFIASNSDHNSAPQNKQKQKEPETTKLVKQNSKNYRITVTIQGTP